MSNVQEWMDCLERFIVEEDKIVTYKWLSIKLKIHVNTSKKLLYSYTNTHDKEKLGICYLIAGEMPDGSCHVVVCRKKDVPKTKESFKNVTSQHVYSIQKCDSDADLNVILNSPVKRIEECIEDFKRLTSIEYPESVVRDNTDLQKLKMKALLASKEAVPSICKPAVSEDKKQIKPEKENLPSNNTNKEPKKEAINGSKKGGLAAMFAAQKEVKTEAKKPVPQQNKPKGGLSMFLNSKKEADSNKSTNKIKIESPKKQDPSPKKENSLEEESPQMDVDMPSEEESQSKKVHDSKKDSKNKSKTAQSKRKRKDKTEEKQKKKRKRIMTMSDSESNDEDNEEEGRIDDSPLREPTPPPPPLSDDEMPVVGKKAKKKKLVESTFMDEEGFLVTKKEYTLVSDSEEEGETEKVDKSEVESKKSGDENAQVDEKKSPANEPKKASASKKESKSLPSKSKISPKSKMSPQKNKQASITSFFTKK